MEVGMVKPRILIVEDERITSDHLHRLLKRRGYEIAGIASNGNSMGFQLIQLLAQQLGGNLDVIRGGGTRFTIRFPRNA